MEQSTMLYGIITLLVTVNGFLLKFLFSKAQEYAQSIDKLSTQVALLAQKLEQRQESENRFHDDMIVIRSRLHEVENRLGRVEARCEFEHRRHTNDMDSIRK